MSLQGSIRELQRRGAQLYLELSGRFSENGLIRDVWTAMAHDESQKIKSLDTLPRSFWNRLKKEQEESSEPIRSDLVSCPGKLEDQTIRGCFGSALDFEEQMILVVYVPLVRCLKKQWTDQSLDLYITVRAHLARMVRVTEAFSGDPFLIRRATALLQNFEKGVQAPSRESRLLEGKASAARRSGARASRKRSRSKAPGRAHSLAQRSKALAGRSKPIVEKVNLRRRRARR